MTELRIIEMLKDIKDSINNKPKEDKWLDINQASNKLGKTLFRKSELENFLDDAN